MKSLLSLLIHYYFHELLSFIIASLKGFWVREATQRHGIIQERTLEKQDKTIENFINICISVRAITYKSNQLLLHIVLERRKGW